MFEVPFYHETIKKATIAFGALFSQLKVIRRNQDQEESQIISTPIAFAAKEKLLVRIEQDANLTGGTYLTLPRMSFDITGYQYDSTRMVNRNNKIQCYKDGVLDAVYTPVPYNVDFQLYIITKGIEDGLALVEQIHPLFTPEYSFTIDVLPEMSIKQDIPLVLNSISVSDDYEGDFSTRRLVTHTLSFTAKMLLYSAVNNRTPIQRTETDLKKFQEHVAEMDEDGNIIVDDWTVGVSVPAVPAT